MSFENDLSGAHFTSLQSGVLLANAVNQAALAAPTGSSLVGTIAAGTGAVARTVQAKERDIVSVNDFGVDASAFQAAIDASTTNGATILCSSPNYNIGSTITLKPNVILLLLGKTTLTWTGAAGGTMFDSSSSTTLDRAGIVGGFIDFSAATGAGTAIILRSPYRGIFKTTVKGVSSTSFILDIRVNTSGGSNPEGNRNAVYNDIAVMQEGTCGTHVKLGGDAAVPTVVTLNSFHSLMSAGCAVRGIELVSWVDNNHFGGVTKMNINANNAIGIEHNTGTPGSDVGVYSNNCDVFAVDSFGAFTGRIAVKMNHTKNNVIGYLFNEPQAEGGVFVKTVNTQSYRIGLQIPGNNQLTTLSWAAQIHFYAKISSAQTFTGAKTAAAFATEVYQDPKTTKPYNTGTSTFTAPYDGNYYFQCAMSNGAGLTVADVWYLTIEGAGSVSQILAGTTYVVANVAEAVPLKVDGYFRLQAGDTVIAYVTRNSGSGNYVQVASGDFCYFQGHQMP